MKVRHRNKYPAEDFLRKTRVERTAKLASMPPMLSLRMGKDFLMLSNMSSYFKEGA